MPVPDDSTRMFAEAAEAAAVVRAQRARNTGAVAALAERLRRDPPASVLTCARGSSDHAATFARYLVETRLGIITSSQAPSVASVYGVAPKADESLCLAISQSGKSPDLLSTVEKLGGAGAHVVALVNAEDSPLAAMAQSVLPLCAGPEVSVAATKSYIAALFAIAELIAAWSADESLIEALGAAPADLANAWAEDWSPLVEGLRDCRGLYVIGRGLGLGIAQEAALKFKETCGLHAEAFSAAEVRHGPMALVGPGFPMLVFRQSDETLEGIDDLVDDVIARGSQVFIAGEGVRGAIALPSKKGHPAIEPMLQIQSFYRAANALSLARGFDPDVPPHLAKVTETV